MDPIRPHLDILDTNKQIDIVKQARIWQSSAAVRSISSKLRDYLQHFSQKKIAEDQLFRVDTIFTTVYSIIKANRLQEPTNPFIVCCDKKLETLLDVKHFHLNELRVRLFEHMKKSMVFSENFLTDPRAQVVEIDFIDDYFSLFTAIQTSNDFDIEATYVLKPAMAKLMSHVLGKRVVSLPYREVCKLISNYIINRREHCFDLRNIKIYIGGTCGDLLGPALKTNIFARSQITRLIRQQLGPKVRRSNRLLASLS